VRYSAIVRGTRETHPYEFALADGTIAKCAFRALLGRELASVLTDAKAFASARNAPEQSDDNPIYQLGIWVYTLVLGCVDVESADQAPFFDEGADQVLTLDVDRIALLYERQQAWQDDCAPLPKRMSGEEYMRKLLEVAASEEGDDAPFEKLPRVLLESFARTTAKQLVSLVPHKLDSGSASETDSTKKLDS
jgi:hypothetical protein